MRAEIFWIDGISTGRLAILPRPRGGDWLEDEIASLKRSGVDTLVSLLTDDEEAELDIVEEENCCRTCGVEFVSFPIEDRGLPTSSSETLHLVQALAALLRDEKGVALHCRQGVGRSALMAACVLGALGEGPAAAFGRIEKARGCRVPDTDEQRAWVMKFVERHLAGGQP